MKQILTTMVLIGGLILPGCTDLPTLTTSNQEEQETQDEQEDIVTDLAYSIVDTGQDACYNNRAEINLPLNGESFYGQDANFQTHKPSYKDNGDGTVRT